MMSDREKQCKVGRKIRRVKNSNGTEREERLTTELW